MALNWTKSGPNNVPEYQLSGVPYVTSSADPTGTTVALGQVPVVVQAANATPAEIALAAAVTPYRVQFPFVTRWVQISNIGSNDLRVGFTENGVRGIGEANNGPAPGTNPSTGFLGQNYFILKAEGAGPGQGPDRANHTVRLELRCTDLFFLAETDTSDVEVVAGLTTVHRSQFPVLTGSTYTQATTVDRRDAQGRVVAVQVQGPLFTTGSSGLG